MYVSFLRSDHFIDRVEIVVTDPISELVLQSAGHTLQTLTVQGHVLTPVAALAVIIGELLYSLPSSIAIWRFPWPPAYSSTISEKRPLLQGMYYYTAIWQKLIWSVFLE